MAWNIPQELMNNNPLNEEEVRKRFMEKGFDIIDYTYKNNSTRMLCYDPNGYKVMVSLGSLSKDVKQYTRFSLNYNPKGFMYNVHKYELEQGIKTHIIDVRKSKKIRNHTEVLCVCECGNEFWCDFGRWRDGEVNRCPKCSRLMSNIEYRTMKYLDDIGVEYIQQYKFEDCKDLHALPFDFYLPQYNLCIEVDGEGHFNANFHKKHTNDKNKQLKMLRKTQYHDKIKTQYCKDNNIGLLRLKYNLYRSNGKESNKFQELINNHLMLG